MQTTVIVQQPYIWGIQEARAFADKYGTDDAAAHIDNLNRTIKGFAANTAVGQMLRGERDFWRNQLAMQGR